MSFRGEFKCKLDSKGRLVLPAKIKSALPEDSIRMILGQGFDKCLILYTSTEFKKLEAQVSGLSEFNPDARRLRRNFFRGIEDVELDGMGRILIPRRLKEFAGLEKEAILVGTGKNVEIWDAEAYENEMYSDEEYSQKTQELLDL